MAKVRWPIEATTQTEELKDADYFGYYETGSLVAGNKQRKLPYEKLRKSFYVDSIAELRTKIGFDGQKVDVLGYYTAGDVSDMPSPVYDPTSLANHNGGNVIRPNGIDELDKGRWIWELSTIKPEWFGAIVNEDISPYLTEIQNAFTGNITIEISENYKLETDYSFRSNMTMISKNNAKITRDTDVRIKGQTAVATPIVAISNIVAGDRTIVLDATSYNSVDIGDYIRVTDPAAPTNSDYITDFVNADLTDLTDWVYQVQQVKIVSKDGSNTIGVEESFHIDFNVVTLGKIERITNVTENVVIDGIHFFNDPNGTFADSEAVPINAQNIRNLTIQNCIFEMSGLSGGIFLQTSSVTVLNNIFTGIENLGVFLRQACPNSKIIGNTFLDQVTGDAGIFLEMGNYNVVIDGNTFDGSRVTSSDIKLWGAIQFDARVHNCVVSNNTINGHGFGVRMELGCLQNVIKGNTFSNISLNAIRINQCEGIIVSDNAFYNCCDISVSGAISDNRYTIFFVSSNRCIFKNNYSLDQRGVTGFFIQCSGFGHNISGNIIKGDVSKVRLVGNNITFKDNTIETSSNIPLIVTGTTAHYNKIEGNKIITSYGGGEIKAGVQLDDGAECSIIHDNNFEGFTYHILLSSTSKAQSIHDNIGVGLTCNLSITAPVMPTNAELVRGFIIYSLDVDSISAQGKDYWYYQKFITGVGQRFTKFSLTNVGVDI